MARLFAPGKTICREDFVRKVDMDAGVPDAIKQFAHSMQFDDATINENGEIVLDYGYGKYSDA